MLADRGHRFWLAGAVIAAAVAVAGFGPTYYLKTWFATPALTQLVHVHAAIFTTWLVVFGAQATLVSANRVDLHRKLGVLAIAVIVAMIVTGTLAAIGSARAGSCIARGCGGLR